MKCSRIINTLSQDQRRILKGGKLRNIQAATLSDFQSVSLVSRIARYMTPGALLLLLVTGSFCVGARQLAYLFRLADAGYADTYILYDVQRFEQTGVIYHDLSQPPYMPSQYSPLVYMFYRLPAQIPFQNPSLGPRLAALTAFLLCVALVISIARALIPARAAWLWALLTATSITILDLWPVQLRGDFPGIFFSLAAIRFLLSRLRHRALLAGMCAGLATQFKFTYVAALAAGALWLLFRKQWRELRLFVAGGIALSIGLYFIFWLREPRMVPQILALAPGIHDAQGCLKLFSEAIREPVVVLALPALPLVVRWGWSRWALILLFIVVSFAVGGVTDVQAGGNVNYFYEGLFALIPLSVMGIFRLMAWSRANATVALFVTGLILLQFWVGYAETLFSARSEINPHTIVRQNERFRITTDALYGRHIFSTIPRMAILDPHPALVEPYLMTYMQRLGKVDPQPILQRVRSGEFDLVVTADHADSWRGVPKIQTNLAEAIVSAYEPYCSLPSMVLYLPRRRVGESDLRQKLHQIGCTPYHEPTAPTW